MSALIRFASRLYPASWRRRYGVEFEALLEDAGRNWRDVLDVLLGALKMQMTSVELREDYRRLWSGLRSIVLRTVIHRHA